jgi:hypothetical protein
MGCGCNQNKLLVEAERRSRAIMCHFCIYAEHHATEPWKKGAVECRISGKPVSLYILNPVPCCPKNKHGPITKYLGIRHYGAPKYLRWLLYKRLTGPVAGCGCIYVLKNMWVKYGMQLFKKNKSNN